MTNEEEKQQSLHGFQNPSIWAFWPYQTIKRRNPDGGFPDCALLVDFAPAGQPFDVHFVDADMFDMGDQAKRAELLAKARMEPAIDVAKLVEEGWVID